MQSLSKRSTNSTLLIIGSALICIASLFFYIDGSRITYVFLHANDGVLMGPTVSELAAKQAAEKVVEQVKKTYGKNEDSESSPAKTEKKVASPYSERITILTRAGLLTKDSKFPTDIANLVPFAYSDLKAAASINGTQPLVGADYEPAEYPALVAKGLGTFFSSKTCPTNTGGAAAATAVEAEGESKKEAKKESKSGCGPATIDRRRALAAGLYIPVLILTSLGLACAIATFFVDSALMRERIGYGVLGLSGIGVVLLIAGMWAYVSMATAFFNTAKNLGTYAPIAGVDASSVTVFGRTIGLFQGTRIATFVLSVLGFVVVFGGVLFPVLMSNNNETAGNEYENPANDEEYQHLMNETEQRAV